MGVSDRNDGGFGTEAEARRMPSTTVESKGSFTMVKGKSDVAKVKGRGVRVYG